jgi:hypothetical protein
MQLMQYRPSAAELLAAIAALLDDEVLPSAPPHLQHKVRVAANVCRIVQREVTLGPALDHAEAQRWASLLQIDGDLQQLRAALSERLRSPQGFDAEQEQALFDALRQTVIGDLQIAKPGYDRPGQA